MFLLAITIWHLLGTFACAASSSNSNSAQERHISAANSYALCSEYLSQSRNAFITGGQALLEDIVSSRYLNEDPFVFCFENIPSSEQDDIGEAVLFLHPSLPNKALNDLVGNNEDMLGYFALKKKTLLANLGKQGDLYNFTEPFNSFQFAPQGIISLSNQLQTFAGFIYISGVDRVHCACQYTGVPEKNYSHTLDSISNAASFLHKPLSILSIISVIAISFFHNDT